MQCSSPNTCTCIDGWKENDCLTGIDFKTKCILLHLADINECVDNTDSCEEGFTNAYNLFVLL